MSERFNLVKGHYDDGLWTENQVRNAVVKGWITEDEFEIITGNSY